MNAIASKVLVLGSDAGYQQTEYHVSPRQMFWAGVKQAEHTVPFSAISGIIFIGCISFYAMHSQTLSLQAQFGIFIMLVTGCFIAILSLSTEKGILHKMQAISSLISNFLLVVTFYNFLVPIQ
jgi:hypothetical protein